MSAETAKVVDGAQYDVDAVLAHCEITGQQDAALELYRRALTLAAETTNPRAEEVVHSRLAEIYEVRGELAKAIEEYRQSLAIRQKLGRSQSEFALMIGVSVSTLQNWEQGRRRPVGPAQALLKIAASNPRIVAQALAS